MCSHDDVQVEWLWNQLPDDLQYYILSFLKPRSGLYAHRRLLQGDPQNILDNLARITQAEHVPYFPVHHPILYRKDRYFAYDLVDTYLPYMDLNEIMIRFIIYLCTKYHYRLDLCFVHRYQVYFKYLPLPLRSIRGFGKASDTTCETTCWCDTP